MKNKPLKRLTATLTAASVVIAGGLVPITAGAATTTNTLDLGTAASEGQTGGTYIKVGSKSGSYYPVSARIPGQGTKAYKTYDISQYTDGAAKVEVSFDVNIDPYGRVMFSVADADLVDTGAFSTTSNMGLPVENGVWSAVGKYDNDGAIVLDGTGEANISSIHNTDATVTIDIDLQTRTQNIKVTSGGNTVTERKGSLPIDAAADSVDTFMITAGTTTGPKFQCSYFTESLKSLALYAASHNKTLNASVEEAIEQYVKTAETGRKEK